MNARSTLALGTMLLIIPATPSAFADGFGVAPDTTSPGHDTAVTVIGGCDGDGYIDENEQLLYKVRFQSTEDVEHILVTLTPKYSDCDGPGPDNTDVPPSVIKVWNSEWTHGLLAANSTVEATFTVSVGALPPGIDWIDMMVDAGYCLVSPQVCFPLSYVFSHAINADETTSFYSTDYPFGGTEERDLDQDEVIEDLNQDGKDESVTWSDLTQGFNAAGQAFQPNDPLTLLSPWSFDQNDGGFRVGEAAGNVNPFEVVAQWGEDRNFDNVLQVLQEDRDPFNGALDSGRSTAGGCGYQTGPGAWHTGRVGSTILPTCMVNGQSNGQCQRYETLAGTSGSKRWFELLTTPKVYKVNQSAGTVASTGPNSPCYAPLARVEIQNLAWNMAIDIPDAFARFTWELDNDCDGPAVDLKGDTDVLGSLNGPYGAVSSSAAYIDTGLPVFAPLASCGASSRPCVTDTYWPCLSTDCFISGDACNWGTQDVNGSIAPNRAGRNSCFFRDAPIPPLHRPKVRAGGPPDNDVDEDCDFAVDENVALNGPLRSMDITRGDGTLGPDLVIETLEDRIGEAGSCFQGAFGFEVVESNSAADAEAGFGVTIDDVVLEWRETLQVPDAAACLPTPQTPGEAQIVYAFKGLSVNTITIHYVPACGATDHAVYWGACSDPELWYGAECGVGISGTVSLLVPEPVFPNDPCVRFVVVGNDGYFEGDYGEDTGGDPRPPYPAGCNLPQDLSRRCD